MKKIWIGAILSVAFVCSVLVYTSWENRRFVDSLPTPPKVESVFETVTHFHEGDHQERYPPSHDIPIPATPSDTVVLPLAEENTSTVPMSEGPTRRVDDERQTESVEQSPTAWQNDDEHQPTRPPFAKKITRIEDMDPDELVDIMRVSLLRRFGDTPEVHTFLALNEKKLKNQPLSLDEHIEFTRAQYSLWPDPRTKKTLEIFLEKRATAYPNSTRIVR